MRKRYMNKEGQPREVKDRIQEDVRVYNEYGKYCDVIRYLRLAR